jgi:hypothetical protein
MQNSRDVVYNQMVDALARKYANAQNLFLTTPADFSLYVNSYIQGLAALLSLVSILNSDGFSEVTSKWAQVGGIKRAEIQSKLDRFQDMPIPPGLVDWIVRFYGFFAEDEGEMLWFVLQNDSASGTPLDMSLIASWTTILANIDTQLINLATGAESGIVKIVLTEYLGAAVQIPTPGVRISRALTEYPKTQAMWGAGATNTFGFPWITNGSGTLVDATIPIFVPNDCEDDPFWATLWRPNALLASNNVAKATAAAIGLTTSPVNAVSSGIRSYPLAGGASNAVSVTPGTPLNGYTNALNEYLWACLGSNSEVGPYATEQRGFEGYSLFELALSEMIAQSIQISQKTFLGMQRWPYPVGTREYNAGRLYNRSGSGVV